MTTVEFKSTPEAFKAEQHGIKCTVRAVDMKDERFQQLREGAALSIRLVCPSIGFFERKITGYQEFDSEVLGFKEHKRLAKIGWK